MVALSSGAGLPVSSRIEHISGDGSQAWEVCERAFRLEAEGADIIHLSLGDSDFDTPPAIIDEAVRAIHAGRTHYPPAAGEPDTRQAIARWASDFYRAPIGTEQVFVTGGAQNALFASFFSIADPGDEVIVFEPAYVTYEAVVASSGATPVHLALDCRHSFELDIERLRAAVTSRTRAILLNTPSNPTGRIIPAATLREILTLCRQQDIWLVSDEVYWSLVYDGDFVSPRHLDGSGNHVIVVSSPSKSHAMTGWRIGWVIAPPRLIEPLNKLCQCMHFGINQFVQDATALAMAEELQTVGEFAAEFKRRRDVLCDGLMQIPGLDVVKPEGGMFAMVGVGQLRMDGLQFANRLLDAAGVAVMPGFPFGPSVKDYVRVGFLKEIPALQEATRRIAAFVREVMQAP